MSVSDITLFYEMREQVQKNALAHHCFFSYEIVEHGAAKLSSSVIT
jgi:hypothetical protein